MANDRASSADDEPIAPEDVDSDPTQPNADADAISSAGLTASSSADSNADSNAASNVGSTADPNDEIPVPIAMSAAEIDERAQVVERLRRDAPNVSEPIDSPQLDA